MLMDFCVVTVEHVHYVKGIPIQSFSDPYSVRMENTDQKNSKYGHFSRSVFRII